MRRLPLAALAGALAAMALPTPALAGAPGVWTQLTGDVSNVSEPGLARAGTGRLAVVWTDKSGASYSLHRTDIGPGGAVAGTELFVSTSLLGNAYAWFDGTDTLRALTGRDGLTTMSLSTQGANVSGSVTPSLVGFGDYGSDVAGAVAPDGTVYSTWNGSFGVKVHRTLSGADTNADAVGFTNCCMYNSAIGIDAATGTPYVGFDANVTGKVGLWTRRLSAATGHAAASAVLVPGSRTFYGGTWNYDFPAVGNVAISGRRGGRAGVWVAFGSGYPTVNRVRLWRVGTSASQVLGQAAGGIVKVSIAPTASGRLWVAWLRSDGLVKARRSNAAGTIFGAPVTLRPPKGTVGYYRIDANAQNGPLDVVINAATLSTVALWHTQIKPGLTLLQSKTRILVNRSTTVTFTVRDAGDPVGGATVTIGTHVGKTGPLGRISFTLHPTVVRRLTVTARKPGWTQVIGTLRVVRS